MFLIDREREGDELMEEFKILGVSADHSLTAAGSPPHTIADLPIFAVLETLSRLEMSTRS